MGINYFFLKIRCGVWYTMDALFGHPVYGVPAIDGQPCDAKYDDPAVLAAQIEKNRFNAYYVAATPHPITWMTWGQAREWARVNPTKRRMSRN